MPALFFRRRDVASDATENVGPFAGSEAAGDFLFDLDHPDVSFGEVVVEWQRQVVDEGENFGLVFIEPRVKVLDLVSFLLPACRSNRYWIGGQLGDRRLQNASIPSFVVVDSRAVERRGAGSDRCIDLLLRVEQASDHLLRPGLLVLLMCADQLTQDVRATQHMQDGEAEVARKVVVNGIATEPFENPHLPHRFAAALGMVEVAGQGLRRGDMQPVQRLADSQTAFVEVRHDARPDQRPGMLLEALQGLVAATQDVVHRPFAETQLEQIFEALLQSLVRQHLVLAEVGHHGLHLGSVLDGLSDVCRKRALVACPAARAALDVRLMLGHGNLYRWDVEHLPRLDALDRQRSEIESAARALLHGVLDNVVRVRRALEGASLVPRLPAGALAAFVSPTLRLGLVVTVVSGGRLATVGAVQTELRLERLELLLENTDLLEQLADQRVFLRRAVGGQIDRRFHVIDNRPCRASVQSDVHPWPE